MWRHTVWWKCNDDREESIYHLLRGQTVSQTTPSMKQKFTDEVEKRTSFIFRVEQLSTNKHNHASSLKIRRNALTPSSRLNSMECNPQSGLLLWLLGVPFAPVHESSTVRRYSTRQHGVLFILSFSLLTLFMLACGCFFMLSECRDMTSDRSQKIESDIWRHTVIQILQVRVIKEN
jgi:hypothetical protein